MSEGKKATIVNERGRPTEYIWPLDAKRCRRCRGYNTVLYRTVNEIRFYRCRSPICRHRYTIRGQRAK